MGSRNWGGRVRGASGTFSVAPPSAIRRRTSRPLHPSPRAKRHPGDMQSTGAAATAGQPSSQPAAAAASHLPNLSKAAVNLLALRETARGDLSTVLSSVRGPKTLIFDAQIIGPLGMVAEASLLKEHAVERILLLSDSGLEIADNKHVIYIIRSTIRNAKMVATQITMTSNASAVKFSVFFVPRRALICERVLEDMGVLESLYQLGEFPLDLIPFDDDLLTLEMDSVFRDITLDGDRTALYYVARSLFKLQTLFGVIPAVYGKGVGSRFVYDMMKRMHRQFDLDTLNVSPEIDALILIDREADLLTPMLTQLTYEGLVDEVFGIRNGLIELELETKVQPEPAAGQGQGQKDAQQKDQQKEPASEPQTTMKKTKIPLNSSNPLFPELRDLSFSAVGPRLNQKAVYIDENYKERHSAKTISEIRDFMKKLPSLQEEHKALGIHINVAERISKVVRETSFRRLVEAEQCIVAGTNEKENFDYLEECINRQEPFAKVLRLICAMSITQNGLKPKVFEMFRRELLQTYGFEASLTLHNLEKAGFLRRGDNKSAFPVLRKSLKLLDEDVDELNPKDISYAYAGYCPLSVRIASAAVRGQFSAIEDSLRMLPGPQFQATQDLAAGVRPQSAKGDRKKVVLVYFLGGVTFSEVSCFRYLSRVSQQDPCDYIVATTKLTNGKTLLESMFEKVGLFASQSTATS